MERPVAVSALEGQLVLPDRVQPGRIVFGSNIHHVEPLRHAPERLIIPGFVDTHVHGGAGGDTIDGVDGIRTLARFHLRHGTTTLLPTTITRPWPEVMAMLRAICLAKASNWADAADIHGAHLEGPFISPNRLGAQPAFAIAPTPEMVNDVIRAGIVRVVTLAPEVDGAADAAVAFAHAGVRISLGHSEAGFALASSFLDRIASCSGVAGGTHLFNAMTGIAGREPGMAGALLLSASARAELILDNHHVDPASFRIAYAMLGKRLMLVTDAMRAAGLGDCDSELGGQRVQVRAGVARLADRTLAGSVLTMHEAYCNAVAAGLSRPEASWIASSSAADYLGLDDRGTLEVGRRADMVELQPDGTIVSVWRGGDPKQGVRR